MNTSPDSSPVPAPLRLKIIGVGSAGTLLVDQLPREDFAGATFAFVDTDPAVRIGPSRQLVLDTAPVRGLGTGGDSARGRALAEAQFDSLKSLAQDTDVVFLVAGLGGGAGSGVMPVAARAAQEAGALVLAFVTLPFECEGNRRREQAEQAAAELGAMCDGLLCLPNQKAFHLLKPGSTFVEAFRHSAGLVTEAIGGIARLLTRRGLVEVHFADLRSLLRENPGQSCFASFEAFGAARVDEIIAKLPGHVLLDGGRALEHASRVIVSLLAGPDLAMDEVNRLMQEMNRRCPAARILMGAAVADACGERLSVTIFATPPRPADLIASAAAGGDAAESAAALGAELLHPPETVRPKTRMVPPPPKLSAEQRAEIIATRGGKATRGRKNAAGPRMRQTTLPLDIVNKGRFDKSEPTIHKGEDLDLPTYVRRGISLN